MPPKFAFTPLPPSRGDLTKRPDSVAGLAGSWRGQLFDANGGSVPFTLLRDGSPDSSVSGRFLFFATAGIAPTGVRLLEAAGRTFVALVGPYYDPQQDADVVTVFEGTRDDRSISGSFYTRSASWHDVVTSGTFLASRATAEPRAA
ncbi:MAG: hypothetical protein MNPFHGCM_01895 [Gemmatimonadaceae bacterium]|nr:hypothetical protein [Gemmatimonadaceae bacterium]